MAPSSLALSRSDLLNWINSAFDVNYQKIEQCGKGVIYCLIFNKLYPQTININKLNKSPINDYQTLQNYKLLQHGFNKRSITRDVSVERLMKCRLQDNLEFLQWFASQWVELIGDIESNTSVVVSESRRSSLRPSRPSTTPANGNNDRRVSSGARAVQTQHHQQRPQSQQGLISIKTKLESQIQELEQALEKSEKEKLALQTEFKSLEDTSDQLNTERNFYLEKLRDIEVLSLDVRDESITISMDQLVESILHILYSTKEGFEVLNEDEYPSDNEEHVLKLKDGQDSNGNPVQIQIQNQNGTESAIEIETQNNNINNSLMETPKSESMMSIIPNNYDQQLQTNYQHSNVLDDEETF